MWWKALSQCDHCVHDNVIWDNCRLLCPGVYFLLAVYVTAVAYYIRPGLEMLYKTFIIKIYLTHWWLLCVKFPEDQHWLKSVWEIRGTWLDVSEQTETGVITLYSRAEQKSISENTQCIRPCGGWETTAGHITFLSCQTGTGTLTGTGSGTRSGSGTLMGSGTGIWGHYEHRMTHTGHENHRSRGV